MGQNESHGTHGSWSSVGFLGAWMLQELELLCSVCQKTLVAVMSKSLRLRSSGHPQWSKWHLRLDMSVAQESKAVHLLVFLVFLCNLDALNQIQEVSRIA